MKHDHPFAYHGAVKHPGYSLLSLGAKLEKAPTKRLAMWHAEIDTEFLEQVRDAQIVGEDSGGKAIHLP